MDVRKKGLLAYFLSFRPRVFVHLNWELEASNNTKYDLSDQSVHT